MVNTYMYYSDQLSEASRYRITAPLPVDITKIGHLICIWKDFHDTLTAENIIEGLRLLHEDEAQGETDYEHFGDWGFIVDVLHTLLWQVNVP